MQNGYNGGGGGGDEDDRKPPYKPPNSNNNKNNNNDWTTPSVSKTDTKKRRRHHHHRGDSTGGTCSLSTDVTATALSSPMTAFSEASGESHHHEVVEFSERRNQLQQQIMVLSITSSAALGFFVLTVLPFAALVAMSLLAASLGLLSYTTYQRLVLEYQQIVAGEGFGRYLWPGIYQLLTEGSLHQFLTQDNTFVREYVYSIICCSLNFVAFVWFPFLFLYA